MLYPNLVAEMARNSIKQKDMATVLGTRAATVSAKLNGQSRLDIDEAWAIQRTFFPSLSLDYLFLKREQNNTA